VLSESDLDPFFDQAASDWFRFEAHRTYNATFEQSRLRAYIAGEPYDPSSEPRQWLDYIRQRVTQGISFSKVRVVSSPLTAYERWECEWSYPATEHAGQRTFILDLAEVPQPPPLTDYDWWMFDNTTVLRMHYDDNGAFVGAEDIVDPTLVTEHVHHKDVALEMSSPFHDYWAAHPQYWRQNWVDAPT
jgi:hypothetical protein